MQFKHIVKPSLLFAAGSMASVAHSAVVAVDIDARPGGTQIAIGQPLSAAQFTFSIDPSFSVGKFDYNFTANGTAGVRSQNFAIIPDGSNSFNSSANTGGVFIGPYDNSGYYGLRFDVGSTTHYGYALFDQGGGHISQVSLDDDSLSVSSSAPEPATWAQMILGLGVAGAAMRRRQRVLASA